MDNKDYMNFANTSSKEDMIRKPDWIRVKAPATGKNAHIFKETKKLISSSKLHTVCEEAACPNIGECWSKKHATVMILGSICTRACSFCNIDTGKPMKLDEEEPYRLAEAISKLNLNHVVITSVDRDDLDDGGAMQFVKSIEEIRKRDKNITIEILTPDFLRKEGAIEMIVDAKPDVFNHNIETVPSLYHRVRPGARYFHSLSLLKKVKELDPLIFTKSGVMVGLGEEKDEIYQLMDDFRSADVDFLTIGQYLRPTVRHIAVDRYVHPDEFELYKKTAYNKGFLLVSSSPLTRSSYHADEDFAKLRKIREDAINMNYA